ncbi:folate-binding protein [Herbiconiux sp. CPCC 203407]|uniref:Folate-binding protein n=1 Tax=Herbiconiux oxytropis TaxID=2970915 RepID=A0AA41XB23_9MICO|nr:folate-binding protein [Herbiconiux oxytropis]MCS5721105.1 folate-binding protein [Herbiconiux oxytropis]MCS5724757.1 folate-binding protein [Herbiconiux oxytropis]
MSEFAAAPETPAEPLPAPFATSALLSLPGAVAGSGADAGVAAHYGNPLGEQRMLDAARSAGTGTGTGGEGATEMPRDAGAPVIVDLSDRGVISVTGPDRLSWLDSVTSQSIRGLAPFESAETLLLSANGRIEHAIRVLDDGETAWLLVDSGETEALETWLQRMRFMLRVEIADRSAEFATVGWLAAGPQGEAPAALAAVAAAAPAPGADTPQLLTWADPWPEVVTGGVQYAQTDEHPGADWWWRETLVPRSEFGMLATAVLRGELRIAGTLAAEALRVAAWRPRLSTEVDDRTIPHELDWMRSAVHLSKGCYRGQETVAKVHNLGHPPRRLVLLHLDGSEGALPAPGDEVAVAGADDATGTLTTVALHHEWGPIALAVVKRQLDPAADLRVRSASGEIAASADEIVSPDAGAAVGRVPRLPRLGARKTR